MPVLVPGTPLATRSPTLLVENALQPGPHRFRLVVVDEAGNESAPAFIEITVGPRPRPVVPPIRPIDTGPLRPGRDILGRGGPR